jgi:hypothetical protein
MSTNRWAYLKIEAEAVQRGEIDAPVTVQPVDNTAEVKAEIAARQSAQAGKTA